MDAPTTKLTTMPPKTYTHWYEWAGDFTKEAMKGWGLATILILLPTFGIAVLTYRHGERYFEASIAKMEKEAAAATAVALAVSDLAELARDGAMFQQKVDKEHLAMAVTQLSMLKILEQADERMSGVVKERAQQTEVLKQIHAAIIISRP